jgi:DNA-binding NarL/FixJ family response regulator
VRKDRFEEAEQLLVGLDVNDDAGAARPLAAIQLARGETSLARDTLERALAQVDPLGMAAAPLLGLLVDVQLAANLPDEAQKTVERLAECAGRHASHHLLAAAALARGRVCLAAGTGDPQACLREALAGFARAQMPMEVARSRLELANALLTSRPEVAMVEARAALDAFERLQAARHADAAAGVLRSLGVKGTTPKRGGGLLTKREAEVLDLLGHGLSNPEMSERLYISRKTVEHHVGNILSKLGLRSRAEAAAYAARSKPGDI